jgi:hypothetical protein
MATKTISSMRLHISGEYGFAWSVRDWCFMAVPNQGDFVVAAQYRGDRVLIPDQSRPGRIKTQ